MPCHRCQSLMFPVDLLDQAGELLHQDLAAWCCFAGGDILELSSPKIEAARIAGTCSSRIHSRAREGSWE